MLGPKFYRGGGQPSPAPGSKSSVAVVPVYPVEEERVTRKFIGYGPCPRCDHDVADGSWRERSINGNTHCGACGYTGKSTEWPRSSGVQPTVTPEPRAELVQRARGLVRRHWPHIPNTVVGLVHPSNEDAISSVAAALADVELNGMRAGAQSGADLQRALDKTALDAVLERERANADRAHSLAVLAKTLLDNSDKQGGYMDHYDRKALEGAADFILLAALEALPAEPKLIDPKEPGDAQP